MEMGLEIVGFCNMLDQFVSCSKSFLWTENWVIITWFCWLREGGVWSWDWIEHVRVNLRKALMF
jgi:hypothetical protein